MSEKDIDFLHNTFSTFLYNLRLHPFLTPNTVNISEAVLLNIFSGRFHSKFLLLLKSANIFWPVSKPELLYHIYENHLRHLCDLDDKQTFRLHMMEEMLTASHWSLNLVTDKMSNNLSPRDSEGWLIQGNRIVYRQDHLAYSAFGSEYRSSQCRSSFTTGCEYVPLI